MLELNKIYNENCLDTMKRMSDNYIDLVVCSPPYDSLRSYDTGIGLEWNFEVFKPIAKELFRITKEGGVIVWVVGDATIDGGETGTSFKQALYFIECGFKLHDTMIYQKHNFSNPSSNRYHQIFEYMFVLSKGKPKTFNPIKDRKNIESGKIGCYGRNTVRQKDGSFLERKKKINTDYGMRYNIWKYKTEMKPIHPAQFPKELANDHILSWSNPEDIVMDCFAGSGTTGIMAYKNNRKFILIEMSESYCDIIQNRFKSEFDLAVL